jgi:hypothetical protein
MKNRTVYLSGKVTGLPRWYVVLKFTIFDLFLTFMGYQVWNPVHEINKKAGYMDSMVKCCEGLVQCDYTYFMFDWMYSDGAKVEFGISSQKDKICINSGRTKLFHELLKSFRDVA